MNGTKKQDPMTKAQVEHLLDRVAKEVSARIAAIPKSKWEIPEPPQVKRARHLVKQWDASHYSRESERKTAAHRPIRQAESKLRQTILFEPPHVALRAVEAFERGKR